MRRLLSTLVFLMILVGCSAKEISIADAWARPGISGGNSAVYFQIKNGTDQEDTLLSVESDTADQIELHQSVMSADGTMTMQPQESVPVAAGETVEFKPGGIHVMLIDLKHDLKPGDTIPLRLNFQTAGQVNLEVTVREP